MHFSKNFYFKSNANLFWTRAFFEAVVQTFSLMNKDVKLNMLGEDEKKSKESFQLQESKENYTGRKDSR